MNTKLKSIVFPVSFFSLSIVITFLLIFTKEDAAKETTAKPRLAIEAFKAKAKNYRVYLESESDIKPKSELVITSSVPGEIIYVSDFLNNGLIFKKGDLLIQIDSLDYSVARINAKSVLDAAELDFKLKEADAKQSNEELSTFGSKNVTDLAKKLPQLKSSKSRLDAAKANYDKTLSDLSKTSIYAPFDGRVNVNYIVNGTKVSSIDRLASIYSVESFKIDFPISLSDLEYLGISKNDLGTINRPNLEIKISSRIGEKTYYQNGEYSGISGNIDKLTQTVNLKVSIDGDSFVLPVDNGVFSKAKIYGKTYEDVFVIPNKSINEKNEIYVVDENTLLKKKVDIIKRYKDSTIVQSGIMNGDLINITPISIYVDSMKVKLLDK